MGKPFVHWVGGKRRHAKTIVSLFPHKFNRYYEPFIGGGAVFFEMRKFYSSGGFFISDFNEELIATYKAIRDSPESIMQCLDNHSRSHCLEYFNSIKQTRYDDDVGIGARFIYLTLKSFNGLYSVNSKGQFNNTFSTQRRGPLYDRNNILSVSKLLCGVECHSNSFEMIKPSRVDLIYCDPPYYGMRDKYNSVKFNSSAQIMLREKVFEWKGIGCYVFVSNSTHDFIKMLYNGCEFMEMNTYCNIARSSEDRGRLKDYLIKI